MGRVVLSKPDPYYPHDSLVANNHLSVSCVILRLPVHMGGPLLVSCLVVMSITSEFAGYYRLISSVE